MHTPLRLGLLAISAALLGCNPDTPIRLQPSETIAEPTVPYGTTLANLSVEGPLRSIFVHYGVEAPPDRLERVMGARTRSATDYGLGMARIGLEVPAEVLESRVAELQRLPWVTEVEVGRDESRIVGQPSTFDPRNVATARRMSLDTVPWGVDFARALEVHALAGATGDDVKVGVLDTGMNCSHPDLSGRIVGGYDYVSMSSGAACTESVHHGTAVAGIIAASITSSYLVGMAPEADIYSVRVCGNPSCTDAAM